MCDKCLDAMPLPLQRKCLNAATEGLELVLGITPSDTMFAECQRSLAEHIAGKLTQARDAMQARQEVDNVLAQHNDGLQGL